jgi:hypothetical protein
VAAGLALITRESFRSIDALAKQADSLGVATERLAGYKLGAELAGIEEDQFIKALEKQRSILFDASQGVKTATEAFAALGLNVNALLRMNADQQFSTIADAISKVENATQRGALAAEIFGARNQRVINFLTEGSAAIEGYVQQAEELGLAVSRVDAAKIEAANDAFELGQKRIKGLGNVIAVELAPIVTGLSEAFVAATGNATTMGETVRKIIDGIAVGIGLIADAWYGWNLIIAQTRVFAADLFAEFKQFDTLMARSDFGQGMRDLVTKVAPGLGQNLQEAAAQNISLADAARETAAAMQAELDALIASGPPSERIAAALQQARIDAEASAQAVAAGAAAAIDVAGAEFETGGDDRARELAEREAERERARFEQSFEAVRQYTLTREEMELEAISRRQEIVDNAFLRGLIGEQAYNELRAEVARKGQEALTEIELEGLDERQKFERMALQKKAQFVLGQLTQMTAGVAQSNRTLFNINKLAAIGEATVNTAAGVTQALRHYPPPLSFVMAAAVAAAGLAQIQAIRGTSFGGGTTPSAAGTVPTFGGEPIPTQATAERSEARSGVVVNVNFNAGQFVGHIDERTARLIGEAIGKEINDRDFEMFNGGSQQAVTIRSRS